METKRVIPLFRLAESDSPDGEKAKKRMAAYCRVSSDKDEQMHSLSVQKEYYENALTLDDSCEFAGIYADEGISGTQVAKREGFLQMMKDCRSGLIDGIVTKSVSRFGRNTVDTLVYTRELRTLGIDVFFEKENIHSLNPEGELLLTLISALSQNESVNLSDNVKWGVRRRYEKGEAGSLPLGKFMGYSQCKRSITINEEEAEVVRRIYKEFLSGFTASQIAERLTADGVPTERGNAVWQISSVNRILRNEKYKGDTLFQKTYIADPISHRRVKNRGELQQFYVENSIPPIVDRTVWDLVFLERERRQQYCKKHKVSRYHAGSADHSMSGRIVCQVCGQTYIQLTSKLQGEKGRHYWRCSSFHGNSGTAVDGRMFTPRPRPLTSKNPDSRWIQFQRKHLKRPEPRQLLCTDIEIEEGKPERAFVRAWNLLVTHKQRYQGTLRRTIGKTDDELVKYRAECLLKLLDEKGTLSDFDYELSLNVLEKIEVTPLNKLTVVFQSGIRITI